MANRTIGFKLTASVSVMAAVAVGIGVIALAGMNRLTSRLVTATTRSHQKVALIGRMNVLTSDLLVYQRGMYLAAYEKDSAGVERNIQGFRKTVSSLDAAISEVKPLVVTARGKEIFEAIRSDVAKWIAEFPELERLSRNGEGAEAARLGRERTWGLYESTSRSAAEIQATAAQLARQEQAEAEQETNAALMLIWTSLAAAIALALGVVWMVRKITRRLRLASLEITKTAEQVTAAARQVSEASQSLAAGASTQAAAVEEMSATSEELASMTGRNSEHSRDAAAAMATVDSSVELANKTLNTMAASMQDISASSSRIARIIKVIDEIAFQTNILALNAAVEAARAGEAGAGFAVVATEVRSLAQRSAQAAKETTGMIEESISRSAAGHNALQQVNAAVLSITEGTSRARHLVSDVSSASSEQAIGIDQMARAISQTGGTAQQNAATAEESAAASEELSGMAKSMNDVALELAAMVGVN